MINITTTGGDAEMWITSWHVVLADLISCPVGYSVLDHSVHALRKLALKLTASYQPSTVCLITALVSCAPS